MSDSAYFTCPPCRVMLSLGKPVMREGGGVNYFHLADADASSNSENTLLTRALWKFLADHSGHPLRIKFSYEPDFEIVAGFSEIGSDEIGEISLEDYVADWPG